MAVTEAQEVGARRAAVEHIRVHLRDFPALNRLIEGEEHSDRLILHALMEILDDFSQCPPYVGIFGAYNFPNLILLTDGVLWRLLQSAVLLYARNDLAYAHAGTQVSLNQVQTYTVLANQYRAAYEEKKRQHKVALNAVQAVANTGGLHTTFLDTFQPMRGLRDLHWQGSTS